MNGARIRAVAFDVDGVLTDGNVWWGADDAEWKRFSFRDIMGLARARRGGFPIALISGEDSPMVTRIAEKTGITHVWKGCKDKAAALAEFALQVQLELHEVCFMGDDINDIPAMRRAGLSAAPANAHAQVLSMAGLVLTRNGGDGAARELLDALAASGNTLLASCYEVA